MEYLKLRFITPIDFSKLNFFIMTVGNTEPTIFQMRSNPIIIFLLNDYLILKYHYLCIFNSTNKTMKPLQLDFDVLNEQELEVCENYKDLYHHLVEDLNITPKICSSMPVY